MVIFHFHVSLPEGIPHSQRLRLALGILRVAVSFSHPILNEKGGSSSAIDHRPRRPPDLAWYHVASMGAFRSRYPSDLGCSMGELYLYIYIIY